jgi:hypothetical protein
MTILLKTQRGIISAAGAVAIICRQHRLPPSRCGHDEPMPNASRDVPFCSSQE